MEILKRHHCHLQEAISSAIRDRLGLGGERLREQRVFVSNAGWPSDERVHDVLRFTATFICEACNSIDSRYLGSRPGPFFSLSPADIQDIRAQAGHAENKGAVFARALQNVRSRETPDYLARKRDAISLGTKIACEWIAHPRFPEWISDEATHLQLDYNLQALSARALAMARLRST